MILLLGDNLTAVGPVSVLERWESWPSRMSLHEAVAAAFTDIFSLAVYELLAKKKEETGTRRFIPFKPIGVIVMTHVDERGRPAGLAAILRDYEEDATAAHVAAEGVPFDARFEEAVQKILSSEDIGYPVTSFAGTDADYLSTPEGRRWEKLPGYTFDTYAFEAVAARDAKRLSELAGYEVDLIAQVAMYGNIYHIRATPSGSQTTKEPIK